jgi:hypothetical protein
MKQNQYNQSLENKVELIKIAIDMHLKSFRVVRQIDHALVQPAQRFEPARFYRWLKKEKQKAERVAVCYEAGCFGYEPARRMQAMGVEVYVIAPQDWDERGKRQVNDKWDAAVMCRRLSEYLAGHRKALSVVRIPSRQEEEQRERPGVFASNCARKCAGSEQWDAASCCKEKWRSGVGGGGGKVGSGSLKRCLAG